MRISDWSSDVCSSDLLVAPRSIPRVATAWSRFHRGCARWLLGQKVRVEGRLEDGPYLYILKHESMFETIDLLCLLDRPAIAAKRELFDIPLWGGIARRYGLIPIERSAGASALRSEEHTSELQSLMRISYAVLCLKKKN